MPEDKKRERENLDVKFSSKRNIIRLIDIFIVSIFLKIIHIFEINILFLQLRDKILILPEKVLKCLTYSKKDLSVKHKE